MSRHHSWRKLKSEIFFLSHFCMTSFASFWKPQKINEINSKGLTFNVKKDIQRQSVKGFLTAKIFFFHFSLSIYSTNELFPPVFFFLAFIKLIEDEKNEKNLIYFQRSKRSQNFFFFNSIFDCWFLSPL